MVITDYQRFWWFPGASIPSHTEGGLQGLEFPIVVCGSGGGVVNYQTIAFELVLLRFQRFFAPQTSANAPQAASGLAGAVVGLP